MDIKAKFRFPTMSRDEFLSVVEEQWRESKNKAFTQILDWIRQMPEHAKVRMEKDLITGELSIKRVDRKRRK